MKIAHVITRMIVGGAQENTLLSCLTALEAGHDVTLITGPSPGPEGELLKRIAAPNLKVIILPELVRQLAPLTDFRAYCTLKKLFKQERYDVVHTHSSKAGVIGRLAASAVRVPVVVHTVHGQAFHRYEKWWKNQMYISLERWAAKHSDKIFAVAQAMIDQCVEAKVAPRSMYKVVYSGMDLNAFVTAQPNDELRCQLQIPSDAPVITQVARLFELKGYEFFIPAAFQLLQSHKNVHFLIVGDGVLKDKIQAQIDAAGYREHFHFTGLVSPMEVPRYLALTTILWHLSLREGLPRTAVQGLAAAKPVIAYQLDGTPEVVITGETGYCLKPECINEVAQTTATLLDNPSEITRLGHNGQELVLKRFDYHTMGQILLEEYQQILQQKNLAAK